MAPAPPQFQDNDDKTTPKHFFNFFARILSLSIAMPAPVPHAVMHTADEWRADRGIGDDITKPRCTAGRRILPVKRRGLSRAKVAASGLQRPPMSCKSTLSSAAAPGTQPDARTSREVMEWWPSFFLPDFYGNRYTRSMVKLDQSKEALPVSRHPAGVRARWTGSVLRRARQWDRMNSPGKSSLKKKHVGCEAVACSFHFPPVSCRARAAASRAALRKTSVLACIDDSTSPRARVVCGCTWTAALKSWKKVRKK